MAVFPTKSISVCDSHLKYRQTEEKTKKMEFRDNAASVWHVSTFSYCAKPKPKDLNIDASSEQKVILTLIPNLAEQLDGQDFSCEISLIRVASFQ